MTIDIAKATELLEHHFATVTPEEFRANLEKFCPELFEQEEELCANNFNRLIGRYWRRGRWRVSDVGEPAPGRPNGGEQNQ